MEVNFCDLEFSNVLLYMTLTTQATRDKIGKLDSSQLKILCVGKILHIAKLVI